MQRVSVWLPCGAYRYVRSEVTCRLDASPQPRTFADFAIDVQLEARPPQPQEEDDASWWAKWGGGDVPSSSEESESESESESRDE